MVIPGGCVILRRPGQIRALLPPVRHEIIDALAARQPQSIGELARTLDRRRPALAYHVAALVTAGILAPAGARPTAGRRETLYRLTGSRFAVAARPGHHGDVQLAARVVTEALRLATREIAQAMAVGWPGAGAGGSPIRPGRRVAARLSAADERAIRRHLRMIERLFERRRTAITGARWAFTWALVPRTSRREASHDS